MPCSVAVELVVAFLKFRNIDLLQQGLYRVVVSVRHELPPGKDAAKEKDPKPTGIPIELLRNNPEGRKGVWQDLAKDTYPGEYMDEEAKEAGTCAFFVRYQEQTEILEEAFKFRMEFDAVTAMQHWGDDVLLQFDLYHVSKEDLEKIPTEAYHRAVVQETGNVYEAYCDKTSQLIEAEVKKAKPKALSIRHNNAKCTITFEKDAAGEFVLREVPANPSEMAIPVCKRPKVVPRSSFQKVASKTVPFKNTLLPHSDFVPVMWADWFAATCQCLVQCCPVSVDYKASAEAVPMGTLSRAPSHAATSASSAVDSPASVQGDLRRKASTPGDYVASSTGFLSYLTQFSARGGTSEFADLTLPVIQDESDAINLGVTHTSAYTDSSAKTNGPRETGTPEKLLAALDGIYALLSYLTYAHFHIEFWTDELGTRGEAESRLERHPSASEETSLFVLKKSERSKHKSRGRSKSPHSPVPRLDTEVLSPTVAAQVDPSDVSPRGSLSRTSSSAGSALSSPRGSFSGSPRRFLSKQRERVSAMNRRYTTMSGLPFNLEQNASPDDQEGTGAAPLSPRSPRQRAASEFSGSTVSRTAAQPRIQKAEAVPADPASTGCFVPVFARVSHLASFESPPVALPMDGASPDLFDDVVTKASNTIRAGDADTRRAVPASQMKKRTTEHEPHFEVLPLSVCLNQFNQIHQVPAAEEIQADDDMFGECPSPRGSPRANGYEAFRRKKWNLRRSVLKVSDDVTKHLIKSCVEDLVRAAHNKHLLQNGSLQSDPESQSPLVFGLRWVEIEETLYDSFRTMVAKIIPDLLRVWECLSIRHFLRSSSYFLVILKKRFWRLELERAKKHFTIAADDADIIKSDSVQDDVAEASPRRPTSSASAARPATALTRPTAVPPSLQLTFTYPKHTFVEFQLLDNRSNRHGIGFRCDAMRVASGLPPETELRPPHPQHPDLFAHQNSIKSSQGGLHVVTEADSHDAGGTDDELFEGMKGVPAKRQGVPRSKAVHLIVFCHGYKGNQYDLRALRNHLALSLAKGVDFLMIQSMEDHADQPLEKLGSLLAAEVVEYIKAEKMKLRRLSFIGHSMGGLVIRSALQNADLEPYLKYLYTYVSLSAPHLGVADADSVKVSGALWVLSYLRQSANIRQLRLDAPGLHSLSCNDKIGLFKTVVFIASEDDSYVSKHSATVDPDVCSTMQKKQKKLQIIEDMLRSLSMHLSLCQTVLRFNVKFHPIGRQELSTAMERAVGKAVHVAFLSNPDFIHSFVCLFRQYFA